MSIEQSSETSFWRTSFSPMTRDALANDDSFLERGIVDSTGIMEVITFIEEEYGLTV